VPVIELSCGIQVAPGTIEKIVEVRKLSAKVQRDATAPEVKKNPALLTDSLIQMNVLKVGQKPALSTLKNEMLMADREYLSAQLRKLTFGPTFTGTYECKACVQAGKPAAECQMTHTFNIDEIPVKGLDEAEQLWWDGTKAFKLVAPEDGSMSLEELKKTAKIRCFHVEDEKLKIDAYFRYPNGADERKIAPYLAAEPAQGALAMHELICRCLLKYGEKLRPKTVDGFTLDWFDELDLDVAMRLEKLFQEACPGTERNQEIECSHGHRNELQLRSVDFLASSGSTA
jgi:hypothetical protein